jgi:hypothetical protein
MALSASQFMVAIVPDVILSEVEESRMISTGAPPMTMRYLKSVASCFAFRRSASLNVTAACMECP